MFDRPVVVRSILVTTGRPTGEVRPSEDLEHPLVIREITIESESAVVAFKYPAEFVVDVGEAPEMEEWAENVANSSLSPDPQAVPPTC